ncbi:MAG: nitroreductase family protein [Deltaproteobacteria bacterium]|nr:nitroreductase family protein [Deltaproteobacteria bacterium]
MKYDGSLSYKGTVTPLQKVMLWRRSFRKYRDGVVTAEQAAEIDAAARAFSGRMGFDSPAIRTTVAPAEFKAVVGAALKGVVGKINPWLPFTKAGAMILAIGNPLKAPVFGDRRVGVAQIAMVMEAAVLHAASMGLGTCWMAGINSREIEKTLGLPDEREIIAISTLGHPPAGISLLSWDGMTHHLVSKKRKPLSELVFVDRLGVRIPDSGFSQIGSIEGDALGAIFNAARVAPSADNVQMWRFVIAHAPETKMALLAALPGGCRASFQQAPLLIAALAEPWFVKGSRREQPFFMIDVPIAISHIVLQAAELGIACAVEFGVDEAAVKAAVGAGEGFRAVALVALGNQRRNT